MSVIIKGMKMPKNCWFCPMHTMSGFCNVLETSTLANQYIPDSCPIIEIPEEHGRLIDADAVSQFLNEQITIIPAEGKSNETQNHH